VDQESTGGDASSGDQLRGESWSKSGEDPAVRRRVACVDGGKGKGVEFDVSMGEYVVRHSCAFESICALVDELSDA